MIKRKSLLIKTNSGNRSPRGDHSDFQQKIFHIKSLNFLKLPANDSLKTSCFFSLAAGKEITTISNPFLSSKEKDFIASLILLLTLFLSTAFLPTLSPTNIPKRLHPRLFGTAFTPRRPSKDERPLCQTFSNSLFFVRRSFLDNILPKSKKA
jgi:hypothetical protein